MPDAVTNALCELCHLVLTITLKDIYHYFPNFAGE